jgi:hypothetical protein
LGTWGSEGVCRLLPESVGFWEESLFLFLGRWYRGWEEKAPRSMKFELCSLHDTSSNSPKFMYLICIICFILYQQSLQWWFRCLRLQTCVGSVCVEDTSLMFRGRECARLGSATRRVSFYVSLVGGGLRLSRPSSGSNGSVRVYRRVIFGKQNW